MLVKIRKRFTYANVIMTLALLFAMSGGAYAAKHYLITSTKQISPKVLKQLKGKDGAPGATGATGAAGAAGQQGAQGPRGPQGPQGPAGPAGSNGQNGKDGSPWTAGGTLPPKATETGMWTVSGPGNEIGFAGISFSIPLAEVIGTANVHYIDAKNKEVVEKGTSVFEEKESSACKGTSGEPQAAPGNLCIYETQSFGLNEITLATGGTAVYPAKIFPAGAEFTAANGAGKSGAGMLFGFAQGMNLGDGTWAVTGE